MARILRQPSTSGYAARANAGRRTAGVIGLAAALLASLAPATNARGQGTDLCAQAQPLPLPATGGLVIFSWDTNGATNDAQPSCSVSEVQGRVNPDVWFSFQPATDGVLSLTPGAGAIALYNGCGGQQLACAGVDSSSGFIDRFPVQAGVSYRIAVQGDGIECFQCAVASSSLAAFSPSAPPANDSCSGAAIAVVGDNRFDNLFATTDASASCASGSVNDVWFRFTAPSAGPYRFRIGTPSNISDGVISLYSSCGDAELRCAIRTNGIAPYIDYGMTAGQTVLVRVASQAPTQFNSPNAGPGTLVIQPTPVPANDTCAGAIPVTTGSTLVDATNTFFNSGPAAPCAPGGVDGGDVWYSYTAPATGRVDMTLGFPNEIRPYLINADLTVYSACGGNSLACFAGALGGPVGPWICGLQVQQGQTYLIRIATFNPNPFNGGYATLGITAPTNVAIPTNTTCETARVVTNGNTNFDAPVLCSPPSGSQAFFFKYTNTTTSLRNIRARTCGSSFFNVIFVSPACDSDALLGSNGGGGCTNDPNGSTVRFCLAPGQSAIITVLNSAGVSGTGVLNITSTAPAANDTCAGAVALNAGNNVYNTTLGCGDVEIPCRSNLSSYGVNSKEVWYKFTAPYNGIAYLRATNTRGVIVAMTVRLACGDPVMLCADGDRRNDLCVPMISGQTYLVSISDSINDSGGDALDFGTGTLRLTYTNESFSIPEEAIPEPEDCDFPRLDGECNSGIAIAPILPGQAYFGTQSVFDPFVVYKDIDDGYYFDLEAPGYVRFVGQTQYPAFVDIINNGGFDTCEDNSVSTTTLNGVCINTFDTGLVYLPVAGRHEVRINADSTPDFWRLCSDNDVNYWIQRVCVDCGSGCDPDVNQDGNADQGDIDYLINVIAGGTNPTGVDPDFNRDGNSDQGDIDALVNVIAGGNCP